MLRSRVKQHVHLRIGIDREETGGISTAMYLSSLCPASARAGAAQGSDVGSHAQGDVDLGGYIVDSVHGSVTRATTSGLTRRAVCENEPPLGGSRWMRKVKSKAWMVCDICGKGWR